MTKYTARHLDRDDPSDWVVDTDGERGEVWCNSEAEAKIIAFALNAVAGGLVLNGLPADSFAPNYPSTVYYAGVQARRYDGPTEGVAP